MQHGGRHRQGTCVDADIEQARLAGDLIETYLGRLKTKRMRIRSLPSS